MNPVMGGTQKVTFGKQDPREYEALKNSMMQQHGKSNAAVSGIQEVMNQGMGKAIEKSASSTVYGNPNIMTNELIQGSDSNFAQKDVPGNRPLEDPMNQTGNMTDQVSSTMKPGMNVEDMESDALKNRLALYTKAAGNAGANLNYGAA